MLKITVLGFFLFSMNCSQNSKRMDGNNKSTAPIKRQAYAWAVELIEVEKEGIKTTTSFRDETINISFEVLPNIISIQLKNVSPQNLYIVWNDCYFEFPGKIRSKIVHSEISFNKRDTPPLNEYLYPGVSEARFIAPRSRVDWNRIHKKWRSFPILRGDMNTLPGSQFSFNLFIHDGDTLIKYPFVFEVVTTYPVFLEKRDNKIYQSLIDPSKKPGPSEQKDTGNIVLEEPVPQKAPDQEDYLELSPDDTIAEETIDTALTNKKPLTKSQIGIQSLLNKMKSDKTEWEAKQKEDDAAGKARQDSLELERSAMMEADSIRSEFEDQTFIDTLSKPENIPLFPDKKKPRKKKPEPDLDGLEFQGIGGM